MIINCSDQKIGKDIYQYQAKSIFEKLSQINEAHMASNIRLLHPGSHASRMGLNVIADEKTNSRNKNLLLALFQELRPEKRGESFYVSYRLNKILLERLAIDLLCSNLDDPPIRRLMELRYAELMLMFERLEIISQSKKSVEFLIIDCDFRSWFTNPCEYLDENSQLLEDPVPWKVDFDGEEFTMTRTEPVLPEQFSVVN